MRNAMKKVRDSAVAIALMGVAGLATAQTTAPTIDTAAATDFIGDQLIPALIAVGAIWVTASAVSGGYNWIKGMASGR